MGCASSNPLVDGGHGVLDNAKETTEKALAKGEQVMHDAGETVHTGIEHVKSAVETGLHSAQNNIGSVVNSIETAIGTTKEAAEEKKEEAEKAVEEATKKSAEVVDDAISDAKTVLAFETEHVAAEKISLKDEFGESINELDQALEETLHIEDIEHFTNNQTTAEPPKPKEETKAEEEITPTQWEAAADENSEKSLKSSLDLEDAFDLSNDSSLAEVSKSENKEHSDILLSDTLSVKSYKSEI